MDISVTGQGMAFLGSLALGGALGLLYDLCRLLRGRFPLQVLGALLDLLYWPFAVVALFVSALRLGDGVVRLYLLFGAALGGALYFLLLSPAVVFLLNRLWDLLAAALGLCVLPLKKLSRLGQRLGRWVRSQVRYAAKYLRVGRGPAGK